MRSVETMGARVGVRCTDHEGQGGGEEKHASVIHAGLRAIVQRAVESAAATDRMRRLSKCASIVGSLPVTLRRRLDFVGWVRPELLK